MLIPKTALFVVDECHCIDQWGGSFRPEFALVPALVSRFKIQRSLWLSATLSAEARARLRRQLPEPQQELGEFTLQKNLRIQRVKVPWNERAEFLKRWLDHSQHAGIVFASTRGACIDLARLMASWTPTPESVTAYHAGLVPEERQAAEDGIRSGRIRWVVATSAFGMGMNFPSLRWVILWQVPYSVLDLAQMLGRAGRTANEPATAFALWDDADFFWLSKHLQTSQLQELRELYETTEGLDRRLEAHFSERPLEHSVET
jgi:ATP-dependent DNA helicase RecQ